MARAIAAIDNQPVGFGLTDPNGGCFRYDERYCQMVEQTDKVSFQFTGSQCGSDVIQKGSFDNSNDALAWYSNDASTLHNGWTWALPGQMNHIVGATDTLQQNGILTLGKYYKVTFTLNRVTNPIVEIVGTLTVNIGGTAVAIITNAGTYTYYKKAISNTNLKFTPSSDFDGAIDDISCVAINLDYAVYLTDSSTGALVGDPFLLNLALETLQDWPYYVNETIYFSQLWSVFNAPEGCYNICIADACANGSFGDLVTNGNFSVGTGWTFGGAGWAIAAGQACHSGGANGVILQNVANVALRTYTLTFTISGRTTGELNVSLGLGYLQQFTTNATHIVTNVTPTSSNDDLIFTTTNLFDGCIDNVSLVLNETSYLSSLCSDCYNLKTTHPCTRKLTWTNDNNGFNMIYTGLQNAPNAPSLQFNLTHTLRLFASFEKPKFPEEMEDFKDSIGTNSVQWFDSNTVYELFFDYLPLYLHKAIRVAKGHDHFYIDGVEWKCLKGDYVPEWRDRKKVAQSRIEITPITEQNLNTLC